jgi:hypothetical protein
MIWFLLWIILAAYSVAGLAILIGVGCRGLWSLLPEPAETVERRERIEHDKAIVAAGKVPGYRG